MGVSGKQRREDLRGRTRKAAVREHLTVLAAAFGFAVFTSFAAYGGEPGWAPQEDGWYYYLEDGSPAEGWVEVDGKSYYLLEGGRALTDAMTPDGYYVNHEGAWYQRKETILNTAFMAPVRPASPDAEWAGKEALLSLRTWLDQSLDFAGNLRLKVTEKGIEYMMLEEDGSGQSQGKAAQKKVKETVLLGLYREPERGRFRLDVKIRLESDYGRGILKAMACQVSSSPELLEDGVYSAWEADNRWGIRREEWVRVGDSQVMYVSGDGYGRFYIRPAQQGN